MSTLGPEHLDLRPFAPEPAKELTEKELIEHLFPERKLSQKVLAFECGLHRTYISGVERGIRNPTILVLDRIAVALKVPAARLLA